MIKVFSFLQEQSHYRDHTLSNTPILKNRSAPRNGSQDRFR